VISNDREDLDWMERKLMKAYERWGLTLNIRETRYLCIGAETENLLMKNNKKVRSCRKQKYLTITLNREGTDD
jgi:hypothetical protein